MNKLLKKFIINIKRIKNDILKLRKIKEKYLFKYLYQPSLKEIYLIY